MSVTGLAGMINIKGLTPELVPPAEIFAGTSAQFRVRLHNSKRYIPSFLINVECSSAGSLILPVVSAHSVAEDTMSLTFDHRGTASVGTVKISSPFPVNFFTRFWTFVLDADLVVFPRLLPAVHPVDGNQAQTSGAAPRREIGHDGELERIAGYSGREPLRVIHWKLSARSDSLQVKEFGRQSAQPLLIDLDAIAGRNLDERISKAAWLVRRWSALRPVGLLLGGRCIAAESGQRHATRLLTELALYGLT
jgi:uncharacterized protein (DUF58 family)